MPQVIVPFAYNSFVRHKQEYIIDIAEVVGFTSCFSRLDILIELHHVEFGQVTCEGWALRYASAFVADLATPFLLAAV